MKNQTVFALLVVLAIVLSSCGTTLPAAPTTPTLLPTQQTVIPTNITYPTFTSTPLATAISYPTVTPLPTEIPYPTASVMNANAVAFVAQDWQNRGPSSLWVANIDGSGERKIVDNIIELEVVGGYAKNTALDWSPDGKWISYISSGELWLVSPDGAVKKKILSGTDKTINMILDYEWAPDGSRIAYALGADSEKRMRTVRILNVETGEEFELYYGTLRSETRSMLWSPNGRYLLVSADSFLIFDMDAYKIIGDIRASTCPTFHEEWVWSPDSERFFHTFATEGQPLYEPVCIAELDGSDYHIDMDDGVAVSKFVWNGTGDFLYLIAHNFNQNETPDFDDDKRLILYDVRTQEQKRLLSLPTALPIKAAIISPNGQILELHTWANKDNLVHFMFVNTKSLSVTEFDVNLNILTSMSFATGAAWSSDNKNMILFAGKDHTPDHISIHPYGAFYTLNIETGKISFFSGNHYIERDEWAVSPIATTP